jgi:hypothetical protein
MVVEYILSDVKDFSAESAPAASVSSKPIANSKGL